MVPMYLGLAWGPLAVSIVLFSRFREPVKSERTLHVMQLAELSMMKGMPSESKEIASDGVEVASLEVVKATLGGGEAEGGEPFVAAVTLLRRGGLGRGVVSALGGAWAMK